MNVQGPLYLNGQPLALAGVLVLQSQTQSVHLPDALRATPQTIGPRRYVTTLPAVGKVRLPAMTKHKFIAFMVNQFLTNEQVEHQRELKDLPGNLDYHRESPTVQSYIDGSRQKEWKKYEDF